MVRFPTICVCFLGLFGSAIGQTPVLISGNADNSLLWGQVPEAISNGGPSLSALPVSIGGLVLNSVDGLGSAWLQVSRAKGTSSVAEVFPDGAAQQAFTLGGGNVLFGGNVPKEWMSALMGTVSTDEPTRPSPGGGDSSVGGGSPVLSVEVTAPSETTVAEVSYEITTANGNDVLYSYTVPLETGGWWILGLAPEGTTNILTVNGLPVDANGLPIDDDGTPRSNPRAEERENSAGSPPPVVPEPGTLALAGLGLACAALRLRRK